jgi:predicted DNA binding CopG/RHH family protein
MVAAMNKHYDFFKSVRNPYPSKAKNHLTIRLDVDTVGYFKSLAEKNGIPCQNLINLYLRECAESGKTLARKWG